jgi:hypothetical protein
VHDCMCHVHTGISNSKLRMTVYAMFILERRTVKLCTNVCAICIHIHVILFQNRGKGHPITGNEMPRGGVEI